MKRSFKENRSHSQTAMHSHCDIRSAVVIEKVIGFGIRYLVDLLGSNSLLTPIPFNEGEGYLFPRLLRSNGHTHASDSSGFNANN